MALPAHTLAYADEVGQAHVRVRLRAGDGSGVNAIAFRAVGQKLGKALIENRGRTHACRGLPLRSTAIRARSACSCGFWMSRRRVCSDRVNGRD